MQIEEELAKLLTSWKEIGCHLGKSVRTVQRWERERGLPVRRPTGGSHSNQTVFAVPDELDAWMRSETNTRCAAEIHSIREELEGLRNEVADLKTQVTSLRRRFRG